MCRPREDAVKKTKRTAKRPAVGVRGIHLDLKGTPPTMKRLIELLDVIAAARYNALLVEWEDMFPWTVHKGMRCETAYTPAEVVRFRNEAAGRGLEIIPLVQCLGHMETPLSLPEFAGLREVPYRSDGLDPLHPKSRRLVKAMIDDVLALLPDVRRFHLGGDEARTLGKGPRTVRYAKKYGKARLYLQHIEPILGKLNARGVRPILWSDMMHDWPAAEIRKIARKADLCPWGYDGHPDRWEHHSATRYIKRFHDNGVTLWGATAYKGATDHNADLCDYAQQEENSLAWVEVARRFGIVGLFATAWSRHSTHRTQTQPIDACLDSLVNVGLILHNGKAPGRDACLRLLGRIGELERFEACRGAMARLSDARRHAWREIQNLREQIVLETSDPIRRQSGRGMWFLIDLKRHIEVGALGAGQDARKAFRGLMPKLWIERYLSDRIEPLLEELAALDSRVRVLEPEVYRATIHQSRMNE